jgi:phenylacetic acid degradation operon negative regulatory protein
MLDVPSALAPLLAHLRREPSRTWSLIVTLYGDAVVPRGGRLWLGTLLEIFAALGITGNGVRTAMSRLTTDGWLERNRIGRNSYYRLAEKGQRAFAEAAERIYGAHRPSWDGAFRLAILNDTERNPARLALEAAGFAQLSPGVLAAPSGDLSPITPPEIILLRAAPDGAEDATRLAARVWPGERLSAGYRRFLDAFDPWAAQIGPNAALSDLEALVARLLLIHEYRRLILRDPLLPAPLLPEAWPGHAARALCARLYARLLPASERWLSENALNEDGPLPPPAPLSERFRNALQNS